MRRRRGRGAPRVDDTQHSITDIGLNDDATSAYDVLSDDGAQQVIDAALEVMRDVGVGFEPDQRAIDFFRDAGCDVSSDGIVKFDPDLVREALSSVAKTFKLWDRPGTSFLDIDCHHTWFMPGMTCIKVYDLESGERRDSNRSDLETVTRVADALPNIDGVCIACKNVERSDIHGEIDEFVAMAENTTKPLEYLCEFSESLNVVIDIARTIRGSNEALVEKPYFLHLVTPLPMYYGKTHADQVIAGVEAGIPVAIGTLPIGGASSPITIAGCMVHALATDFAGIVLGQLVRRGCYCVGGSDVNFMEVATGGMGGLSQQSLADMAACQVRRKLDMPSLTGIGGDASARRFNQDAVWEISTTMMQAFYSRPATLDYLGSLDEGITYSIQALLLCDDLAGLLRKMWRGVTIDRERLALDLIGDVGPGGNFLAQEHTAKFCRSERWQTRYFGENIPLSSGILADKDLFERIDAHLCDILQTHQPQPLEEGILREIRTIQRGFEETFQAA